MIGFLGIVIMNLEGLSFHFNLAGDGLVIIGILAYAFSVVMTKIFAQKEDPIVLCGYQMSLGGVALTNLIVALVLVCAGIVLWGYEKKEKNHAE